MNRRTLTELAANPDLISGIYNYCDRWCEKCQFTSRCLLYATEQEDPDDSPESRDIQNKAFWDKLGRIFQETKEMLTEWAEEAGVDRREYLGGESGIAREQLQDFAGVAVRFAHLLHDLKHDGRRRGHHWL